MKGYVVRFHDPMNNRHVVARDLVHGYIAGLVQFEGRVGKEEKVAAGEGRFHGLAIRDAICMSSRAFHGLEDEWTYLRTTTIGDSQLVMIIKACHNIRTGVTIMATLSA